MSQTIVLDQTICYLIGNKDDEIFIFPRRLLEPSLTQVCRKNHSLYKYFTSQPWIEKQLPSSGLTENAEELIINIFKKSFYSSEIKIEKKEFYQYNSFWDSHPLVKENDFIVEKRAAMQIYSFLLAFGWISKAYSIECTQYGDNKYDFRVFKKSSLSFLGKKGDLVFMFQWDDFLSIKVDRNRFTIFTKSQKNGWGAGMGISGFVMD
jgi:hypothetical protein